MMKVLKQLFEVAGNNNQNKIKTSITHLLREFFFFPENFLILIEKLFPLSYIIDI